MKLRVTEIQRFCMHDGPGIRTTVFLKGCPLRCSWCHNPETQKISSELLFYKNRCILCGGCAVSCNSFAQATGANREIDRQKCILCFACAENCPTGALAKCGEDMTVDQVLEIIQKDKAFYGENGGITVSGGEPFTQGEATIALLRKCKELGLSTAVETCGYADTETLCKAAEFVDLFLWDIKDTDSERHKQYTGVSNKKILENLSVINKTCAKIRLRCILVNGINTHKTHYKELAVIAKKINNLDGLEFIPYHAYGGTKFVFLGFSDSGRTEWIPTEQQILEAKAILKSEGVNVI
ncbi:MAG: glycyl-radical enzyme activating protein [Clostridia bacterium]|nr:glycyl-radical enzyme activating protein [Clostridia bacterium]